MKAQKLPRVYLLVGLLVTCVIFMSHWHATAKLPAGATTGAPIQYNIVFDAGSTGTRINVFQFQLGTEEIPTLKSLAFKAIGPGLSAYTNDPEETAVGLKELLKVAMSSIPPSMWSSTPVVLRATAGLRLLPGEEAQQLLDTVKKVFLESPFLNRNDQVFIMTGSDEGIFAWISVNYLAGSLRHADSTVGMMDLGGGSIQITFRPRDKRTLGMMDTHYIRSIQMFNVQYTVYSQSYLGLGLMSARLGILGGGGGSSEFVSPCLAPEYSGSFKFGNVVYAVKGRKAGQWGYKACLRSVQHFLDSKVTKVPGAADMDFYAFSYFYDRAVNLGFLKLGTVKVSDYINGAKRVCRSVSVTPEQNPFFCLDLVYISVLLQKLGFSPQQQFKVAETINHIDVSWTLGAALQLLELLK